MEGQKELRDAIGLCMALAEENPCRMKDMTMGTIAKALRALVSKEYTHGMNQRQLGKYYGVDARTIQRWAKKYPDFPQGRHDGDKEVTYEMEEVMRWKRKHLNGEGGEMSGERKKGTIHPLRFARPPAGGQLRGLKRKQEDWRG